MIWDLPVGRWLLSEDAGSRRRDERRGPRSCPLRVSLGYRGDGLVTVEGVTDGVPDQSRTIGQDH